MESFNLSTVNFTNRADVVEPGVTIFNPEFSNVSTLRGADRLIGTSSLNGDFGFGILVGVEAENFESIVTSTEFTGNANLIVQGINNEGIINTNRGRDIVRGTATANISAATDTVSQVIAIAETADTSVINDVFASLDIQAIADGIDNSGGEINTNRGNDTIGGEVNGSIAATATATADASAIVEAIAQAPMSENLIAFANAIATSLTTATISARGINNQGGRLTTSKGQDTISANATSSSGTFAGTSSSTFASAPPENQAIAIAVADAVAEAADTAIAIDNADGTIRTGRGRDMINATAEASNTAIAINNTGGTIRTGRGRDMINAQATGAESFGIFGGTIDLGNGNDSLFAGTLGGGVSIDAGSGDDLVDGFGDATVDGGEGFDTLSLDSNSREDFNITFGDNSDVSFNLDGITLNATGFEQFNFAGEETYTYDQLLATV